MLRKWEYYTKLTAADLLKGLSKASLFDNLLLERLMYASILTRH